MQADGHTADPIVQRISFRELIERPKSHRSATANTSASCQDKKKRRVAHASIVSSSPYLKELQEAKQATLRRASVKRKLLEPDTEREKSQRGKNKRAKNAELVHTKQLGEDVIPCDTCGLRFCDDKSGRRWIQCQICMKWFHNSCQGLPEKTVKRFCCILCDS